MRGTAGRPGVGRAAPCAAPGWRPGAPRLLSPGKVLLVLAVYLGLNLLYYTTQRLVLFPVRRMEPTALDRWLPFAEGAAWPYLSLFLLIPVAPALMTTRRQLRRYAADVAAIALLSALVFLLWPTSVARPDVPAPGFPYAAVVVVDRPLNSC